GMLTGQGGQLDLSALAAMAEDISVGPTVLLREPNTVIRDFDVALPLEYRNFSRFRNPADEGTRPSLEKNPVLTQVAVRVGKNRARGDFLLDTGAASSFISSAMAKKLGLLKQDGTPAVPVVFSLPMSGISGKQTVAQGFVVSQLRVRGSGRDLVFKEARVLVHDVAAKLDDGEVVVLDGIFGNNLMLPSVSGVATGLPSATHPGAFAKIWVDGPKGRLLFKLK
ncbi:MAG: retropepsin-like aspartic protease, partial [Myxococcota bacterium]